MNELMRWVGEQPQAQEFDRDSLTRVIRSSTEESSVEATLPKDWKSPTANKLLVSQFPFGEESERPLNPNNTIVIGGMCLLTAIDMKRMARKEIGFESINEFRHWFSSWYPRVDQLHDTVGIPPKVTPKVLYVSEDSFFADRISSYTGLDRVGVQSVLRGVHEDQGHPSMERFLRNQGYKGEVSVIYTSDVEEELDLALAIWERLLGKKFRTGDRNFAKVELMYTGMWLDILDLGNPALILEAASKMKLKGYLKLEDWFRGNSFGEGVNRDLGIAGYLPFLTSKGDSSVLGFDEVPNFTNSANFEISDEDMPWYVTNLLYAKKKVVEDGPESISLSEASDMIKSDLIQYYDE